MITLENIKTWAQEAEHAASAEVQKFVAYVEGKSNVADAIALVEAAGYVVTHADVAPVASEAVAEPSTVTDYA